MSSMCNSSSISGVGGGRRAEKATRPRGDLCSSVMHGGVRACVLRRLAGIASPTGKARRAETAAATARLREGGSRSGRCDWRKTAGLRPTGLQWAFVLWR